MFYFVLDTVGLLSVIIRSLTVFTHFHVSAIEGFVVLLKHKFYVGYPKFSVLCSLAIRNLHIVESYCCYL